MIALSYDDLAQDPAKYAGKRFILRGKVMDFTDYDGRPCALICVTNPSTGVWQDAMYVVLSTSDEVQAGDVLTDYDKLIDRQMERAAVSAVAGFAQIYGGAAQGLSY